MLPELSAMLDKLAKKNVIHKNKASNLKSSITKHAQSLNRVLLQIFFTAATFM
jgi:small subunit ribosomal protein S20